MTDVEGRAREMLAQFQESRGNKAGAFTVRQVGPTGIVLEAQHAVLVYALRSQSERVSRLEEALKFYADFHANSTVGDRARSALNQGADDGR